MPDCFWTGFIGSYDSACGAAPPPPDGCDGVPDFPVGIPLLGTVTDNDFGDGPETAHQWNVGAAGTCSEFAALADDVSAVLFTGTGAPEDYFYGVVSALLLPATDPAPTSVTVVRYCDAFEFSVPVVCAYLNEV